MKKFLSFVVCSLLTSTTFALTITGTGKDALTNKNLESVSVAVGYDENSAEDDTKTNDKGIFELDFTLDPQEQNPAKIWFSKAEYLPVEGELKINDKGELVYSDEFGNDKSFGPLIYEKEFDHFEELEGKPHPVYKNVLKSPQSITLPQITLTPAPKPIIRGKISVESKDKLVAFEKDVKIGISNSISTDVSIIYKKCRGKFECPYVIEGYFGTQDKPVKYYVDFYYGDDEKIYKPVEKEFYVYDKILENENIRFKKATGRKKFQENLTNITGFKCSELMPKYLVGANCLENNTLEGDATDLAYYIQKFGGMITRLIGLLAVALIVFYGFRIATAAGDDEQISNAKKGIMWTIIGLALTMFAYIIVKSVIMLTYTQ